MSKYHHGDLPRQLLDHAAAMAAETNPASITLRELARRTKVTHSAPVHHFGTRQGLLTELAIEGFRELNETLSHHRDNIHEMGTAYVLWALENPGHYATMWQPRLLDETNLELKYAREEAWKLLSTAVAHEESENQPSKVDSYAAFALVHGLASIWLSGTLPLPDDLSHVAQQVTRRLTFDGAAGSAIPDSQPF
ncbi:MAG: TetR/AcrR family transcriptional regulator [Leucobacter sp.]